MNYNQIFLDALRKVLDEYERGEIRLLAESDLQSHLFCECIGLLRQRNFPIPLKVYSEKDVFEKRKKIDLVLGDDEVLVELKFEPENAVNEQGRVFTTIKAAGGLGYGSVEEDLQKVDQYAKRGKHAYFVMIDETGWHANAIIADKWRPIRTGKEQVYLLHVHNEPVL